MSARPVHTDLPIDSVLPLLLSALERERHAVLQAPPGAGKTTRVPLVLLEASWRGDGRIIVLEPRRLAARASARRMAFLLGEPLGETVGYRVRHDTRIGPGTRVEVVTEGVFLRLIQSDPSLEGVAVVVFDELHERRLDSDLALALTLETRAALRADLRLVAMSATLDGAAVAGVLGGAPVITSEGRSFPVEVRYLPSAAGVCTEAAVAGVVRRVLAESVGDILVFLPGGGEIQRVHRRLAASGLPDCVLVAPLYGDLSQDQQDAAVQPMPDGWRKVVLATSIAETSLTIDGVRVVVDGGMVRAPRFDPRSGMARLETVRISQASATQRAGRAGRTAPGVCYRLWPEAAHKALPAFTAPEITHADLAPLALELAVWGADTPSALTWLDPPPGPAYQQACALLRALGAIDAAGRLTGHGAAMAGFGVHPRLAHLMIRGAARGLGRLACRLAALLSERDVLRPGLGSGARKTDIRLRLDAVWPHRGRGQRGDSRLDSGLVQHVRQASEQWARQLGQSGGTTEPDRNTVGLLVALAYPDRIAQRRPGGTAQYRLANGRGAILDPSDVLAREPWLAVADLDGDRRDARVFLAAPVVLSELLQEFATDIVMDETITWDERQQSVVARRQRKLAALVLEDGPLARPDADRLADAFLAGVRTAGMACLPWSEAATALRHRVAFVRAVQDGGLDWPDLSDDALVASLDHWLRPFVAGMTRLLELDDARLDAALHALLPAPLPRRLDSMAPTHLTVPSGSRIRLDYGDPHDPVLPVRLQEMFGATETPRIAEGRHAVTISLLSPAGRPVQITRDLVGFWRGGYRAVKAELKGRYPKHAWPDDPLAAPAMRGAKPPRRL